MVVIEAFYTGRLPLDLQALDRRILKLEDAFSALTEKVDKVGGSVDDVAKTGVELLATLNQHIIQEQKDRVVLLAAIVASLTVAIGTLVMQLLLEKGIVP